jgi:hypothetical protein
MDPGKGKIKGQPDSNREIPSPSRDADPFRLRKLGGVEPDKHSNDQCTVSFGLVARRGARKMP